MGLGGGWDGVWQIAWWYLLDACCAEGSVRYAVVLGKEASGFRGGGKGRSSEQGGFQIYDFRFMIWRQARGWCWDLLVYSPFG